MSLARCSLFFAVLLFAANLAADDAVKSSNAQAKDAVSPELRELIRQLDADDFRDRTAASEALAKLGKEALPGLEEGVRSDSPEAATRSFELLQQLFEQGSAADKAAARSSLGKIAQGSDRVATQAKKLLEPKPNPAGPNAAIAGGLRLLPGGAMRIRGFGRIMPAIPAAPGVVVADAKSISINIGPDGIKTIDVDDNGKKFKLVESAEKGIEVEMTETKDGKETTERFAAKDADELKEKHPEAHKLYEKYTQGGDELRLEVGGIPAFAALRGVGARAGAPPMQEHLEALLKRVEVQIAKVKEEKDLTDIDKAKLQSFERLREHYQTVLKDLEAKMAKIKEEAEQVEKK